MAKFKNSNQIILDNLLEISSKDGAVFTTVDNKYFFDLHKILGEEYLRKVYNSSNFEISFEDLSVDHLSTDLDACDSLEKFEVILENYNLELNTKLHNLKKVDLKQTIEILKGQLIATDQKQTLKWKMFAQKAQDIHEQVNIWPMHIGFCFIKVCPKPLNKPEGISLEDKTENKAVYAPLFLKAVNVKVENGKKFIYSDSDVKVNEKLLFILKNSGFDFDMQNDVSYFNIKKINDFMIKNKLKSFNIPEDFAQPFIKFKKEDIKNSALEFYPGIVLGIFPSNGGYARLRMKEILDNDLLPKILDVKFNKNIYKKNVDNVIYNSRSQVMKITPTDLSQDKAIASGLRQNTIIFGPPGTGKSQTIVNIIANILYENKTAIVCSQKREALEVIRNRLGELDCFCLAMLSYANIGKRRFYEPIQKYLKYLETFTGEDKINPTKFINYQEVSFVKKIKDLYVNEKFSKVSAQLEYYNSIKEHLTTEIIDLYFSNQYRLKLPDSKSFNNLTKFKKQTLKMNNLRFKIFNKTNKWFKKNAETIFNYFNEHSINLEEFSINMNQFSKEDIEYMDVLLNILPDKNDVSLTNIEKLKASIAARISLKIEQLEDSQKRDLVEFTAAIRHGKLDPGKFITMFGDMIKIFFPVIIFTPDNDMSAWEPGEFDYAIMDESSQIFLERGIPILYLAKIKILAGDDKQMQPSSWFSSRYTDESVYGKLSSLLDFAVSSGIHSILLDKNYRSNWSSLMNFSSKHFYNSSLDVVDRYSNKSEEAIEVYDVKGVWENNINIVERDIMIALANENLSKYEKIILLCFNKKQHTSVLNEILANHKDLEDAINEKRILLRNIENIQGDEANLIIMSVSYDKNTAIHSTYVGRPGGMNALNVSISRAKDKMIVIKSLKSNDLIINTDNDDTKLFKNWLRFLELNYSEKQNYLFDSIKEIKQNKSNKVIELKESENDLKFELDVKNSIEKTIKWNKKWSAEYNTSIGSITVDVLLKYNNIARVAILIDKYKYAKNVEEYQLYNSKMKFLKVKEYPIIKIDPITYYSNIEAFQNKISRSMKKQASVKAIENTNKSIVNKTLKNNPNLLETSEIVLAKVADSVLENDDIN